MRLLTPTPDAHLLDADSDALVLADSDALVDADSRHLLTLTHEADVFKDSELIVADQMQAELLILMHLLTLTQMRLVLADSDALVDARLRGTVDADSDADVLADQRHFC